jgi:stearoyl-CoA desaturase (delta-9 desaturase)
LAWLRANRILFAMDAHRPELAHKFAIIFLVGAPLAGVIAAIVFLWNSYVFPLDLVLMGVFYPITAMGITIGYHRMLTHQGFKSPEWLRGLLLILGCMAFEGAPDVWAATHIKHHAHADEEGDPHSPLEGFWHAHIGWLYNQRNFPLIRDYAPQLLEDKTVQFVSKYLLVWMGLSLFIPFLLGGVTGFVWGALVRIFITTHVTWSVNSVCHVFGKRAFETTDESRNEWVVGLLAFGEGWHNNHHAFPRNAFHGMRWWQFDLSGLTIRLFEKLGLASDVQRVAPETEAAHRTRTEAMLDAIKDLRMAAINSVWHARAEISALGAKFVQASLTDDQREHCHQMQMYAMQRLDTINRTIAKSAHLKRQKLAQYQKEAQQLMLDCKQRWAVLVGDRASA